MNMETVLSFRVTSVKFSVDRMYNELFPYIFTVASNENPDSTTMRSCSQHTRPTRQTTS